MNLQKNKLHQYLMKIGKSSGCHQRADRSFFWHGYQFPVCARCTGIGLGYLIGGLLYLKIHFSIEVCLSMCLVMFIDWHVQYLGIKESTNVRRLFTGIICGTGYMQLMIYLFKYLIKIVFKQ